jgi:hypothetical protein
VSTFLARLADKDPDSLMVRLKSLAFFLIGLGAGIALAKISRKIINDEIDFGRSREYIETAAARWDRIIASAADLSLAGDDPTRPKAREEVAQ